MHIATLELPLVLLLEQDGVDEADDAVLVGKDAHDIGKALTSLLGCSSGLIGNYVKDDQQIRRSSTSDFTCGGREKRPDPAHLRHVLQKPGGHWINSHAIYYGLKKVRHWAWDAAGLRRLVEGVRHQTSAELRQSGSPTRGATFLHNCPRTLRAQAGGGCLWQPRRSSGAHRSSDYAPHLTLSR